MNIGQSTTTSARGVGDSLSQFGGSITYGDVESTSQFVLGDDERLDERDVDASVRALRPRSTRRGSWESEASGWSARIQAGAGSPSLTRERSQQTSNSLKAGILTVDNPGHERLDDVKDRDDLSPVSGVSVESPSNEGRETSDGNLTVANADVADRKVLIDVTEPVNDGEHKEHAQIIKFVSNTQTRLDEDGSSGISPGHGADTT